mmetsp:Transcript_142654/g.455927  ORF Transcript_142654/g.455927 Transcript_142654/m.455927 type:complete len:498 (-) Transcript_142654:317-1810(-)
MYAVAGQAITAALSVNDSSQVQAVVERAVALAANNSAVKRAGIKSLLGDLGTVVAGAKVVAGVSDTGVFKPLGKIMPESEGEKAKMATCVVRVGYATSLVAQAASDIHDAVLTCPQSKHSADGTFFNNTRGQVCSINVGEAVMDLVALSATLSSVAEDCSASLVPNFETYCAAAVLGFVTAMSQFAGTGVLFAALCGPNHPPPPPGMTPSNMGSTPQATFDDASSFPYLDFHGFQKRAASVAGGEAVTSAPPRKLLYGGGMASTGVQCYVDISDFVWFLAQAGLSISSASGHTGLLGGCPPKNMFGGDKQKGPIYHWAQMYCAADVTGIITFLGAVAAFIQFAVVNCGDVLDLPVICGAAIAGSVAGAASTAQTVIGMQLACNEFQQEPLKKLVVTARAADMETGGAISHLLGRRLQHMYDEPVIGIKALKKRYGSPEEVWKSIGFELGNLDKNLRQELKEHEHSVRLSSEDIESLLREAKPMTATTGLFAQAEECL